VADQRWIFVVRALDQPGTLTAAAAVFSSRGVSLESMLASGIAPTTLENGRLVLIFRATAAKQALLKRTLERLSIVFQVEVYAYEDEQVRAIAVAKLVPTAELSPASDCVVEAIAESATRRTVMVTGTPPAVDDWMAQVRERDALLDVVMAYITI
jgi:acetolactate synthase small subunit